jgi:DNA-binding LacI/PurR family transcriptional regulator
MGKKIRNKDLAARLGVSGTLVSLVLNNKGDQHGIKRETQEKVLALARQMGYFSAIEVKDTPSPVEEKPGIIGMIVSAPDDPLVAGITPFLQKAFNSIGFGFSIITKDVDDERFARMIGSFRKFFTGLILTGNSADESTIRTLRAAEYPFILLESSCRNTRMNTVCSDYCTGSKNVAEYIKKRGYKNILILTDSLTEKTRMPVLKELSEALDETGSFNKPVILNDDKALYNDSTGYNKLESFLVPPHRTEVIVVLNAGMVYPLINFLRKKKVRIPQDLALISMEEGSGFDLIHPAITCLRKPLPAMALKTANILWSEIKNNGKGKFKRQINLLPELLIRESC